MMGLTYKFVVHPARVDEDFEALPLHVTPPLRLMTHIMCSKLQL